jgi:hypothetical protein
MHLIVAWIASALAGAIAFTLGGLIASAALGAPTQSFTDMLAWLISPGVLTFTAYVVAFGLALQLFYGLPLYLGLRALEIFHLPVVLAAYVLPTALLVVLVSDTAKDLIMSLRYIAFAVAVSSVGWLILSRWPAMRASRSRSRSEKAGYVRVAAAGIASALAASAAFLIGTLASLEVSVAPAESLLITLMSREAVTAGLYLLGFSLALQLAYGLPLYLALKTLRLFRLPIVLAAYMLPVLLVVLLGERDLTVLFRYIMFAAVLGGVPWLLLSRSPAYLRRPGSDGWTPGRPRPIADPRVFIHPKR